MSQSSKTSGPQFRADRPIEQETVRTTIVGGRPPGSGQPLGAIPRGLEVLIKKAAVDPQFKERLLAGATAAAAEIGLPLDDAERLMLQAVPPAQLETIIAQTRVPEEHRRAFLGQAASAMLAALGLGAAVQAAERLTAPGGAPPGPEPPNVRPKPKTVEERVLDIVTKRLKLDSSYRVARDENGKLRPDWKATRKTTWKVSSLGLFLVAGVPAAADDEIEPATLEQIRKDVEREFKIKISAKESAKFGRAGQWIEHVEKALNLPLSGPEEFPPYRPPAPVSHGIQPDRPAPPPAAGQGGVRPDNPAPPQ